MQISENDKILQKVSLLNETAGVSRLSTQCSTALLPLSNSFSLKK